MIKETLQLHTLPKVVSKSHKRHGQGRGSGRGGHTSGRGQKGQSSRTKIGSTFEGTKIKKSLLKRLPLLRGKGRLKPNKVKPMVINLKYLNLFKEGAMVDYEALMKVGLVGKETKGIKVKILGEGSIEKALTVKLPVSKGARTKIEKAGGKVLA